MWQVGLGPAVTLTPSFDAIQPITVGGSGDGLTIPVADAGADLHVSNAVVALGTPVVSGSVVAGNGVQYTLSVTNNGPSNAAGVSVSDVLGSQVLAGARVCEKVGGVQCDDSDFTANSGAFSGGVIVSGQTFTPGQTRTWVVRGTVDPAAANNASLTNSASASSSTTDPAPGDESASADTTIVTRADLHVSNAVVALGTPVVSGSVVAGNGVQYTLSVTNNGPSNAAGVSVSDVLGSQVLAGARVCEKVGGVQCDDSDFTANSGAFSGGVIVSGQTFTPGQTRTWVVRGTVDPAAANNASLTNSASASSSTTDPAPGDESASADTTIVTRADLHVSNAVVALGTPVVSGSVVAGNGVQYTLSVTNNGPSNAAGVSVSDVLGSQVLAGARVCEKVGGVQCDDSDFTANSGAFSGGVIVSGQTFTPGQTRTWVVRGTVDPAAANNASLTNSASASSSTTDPAPGDESASADTTIVTRANLVAGTLSASPVQTPLFANGTASQNAVKYTFEFTNSGPSWARNVKVTDPLTTGLVGIDWGFCSTASCSPTTFSSGYPSDGVLSLGDVHNNTTVTIVIHAKADATFRNASNSPVPAPTQASVSSDTTDQTPGNESASDSTVTIASRPSVVRQLLTVPGNHNALVTWRQPQYTGGADLLATHTYRITLTPAVGQPVYVDASALQVTCPSDPTNSSCYQANITGLANDSTTYTVDVQAQNSVDFSDDVTKQVTPSANAFAQLVQNQQAGTLTTCTTATSSQLTCVSYQVPTGGTGGVFGAAGVVPLPGNFCGVGCAAGTGAQNLGALSGYNDPKHPLVETITWDSSTLLKGQKLTPVCGTHSTATNCFPNNVPIFYEMSFTLANFPTEPSTQLNLPGATHFCADPVSKGGAGNVAWARPKPTSGGLAKFNGYKDSAGSACIQSISVLNGLPGRPNQKGDVQAVLNLVSDSDALAGHH